MVIEDLDTFVFPAPIEHESTENEFAAVRIVRHADFEVLGGAVKLALRYVEAVNRLDDPVFHHGVIPDNPHIFVPSTPDLGIHLVRSLWEEQQRLVSKLSLNKRGDVLFAGRVGASVFDHVDNAGELSRILAGIEGASNADLT
ncbi:hypothetical protein [Haladaptatus sp. DYF46]|uniref:hypothetical protein n=1 Tax=Haladaptatus sp. DYF46 TaxID=2886041 RepID=UPI001E5DC208|nr:hypothetical protein [Haladaptatus sp. DYF46]